MPFRRARPIDTLFDAVAGKELVLTADAPLALALNRRVDGPRLGSFAATPRNYVKQGVEVADRRELFHAIVHETELSFKQAATALDRVLAAWEDTGDSEAILGWEAYRTPAVRSVVDIVTGLESAHTLREDVTEPDAVDLAVIGLDGFSALDRAVLPQDEDAYQVVDSLVEGERFDPPPFDVLSSPVEIVQTLEAHITPANAGDVGIVMDPAGPLRPLVESMLDARQVPYHTEEALGEHPEMRSFLRLLRVGLSQTRLTGRDLRGLLAEIGLPARVRDDRRRLPETGGEGARRIRGFFDAVDGASLGDALSTFEDLAGGSLPDLREILDELGLSEAPVDAAVISALEFYLDTYSVEQDYTRRGVLLASGRDNAYVDRPLVFFLGLGTGWAQSVPVHPWIDEATRTAREQRDLARFERLLQSGRRQIYLVQDARRGKPVTPCLNLHELFDADFTRFTELAHRERRAPPVEPGIAHPARDGEASPGFDRELPSDIETEPAKPETLSASALDLVTHCPRDYYMDELVTEPDADALERGRLIHELARLLAAHPDAVDVEDPAAREALVDLMLEELAGLVDPDAVPALATELEVALLNLGRWLDANPPAGDPVEGYGDPPPDRRERANRFAEHLDVELDPSTTERWFASPELGVHGKVDLVHGPRRLVDWKSTRSPDTLTRTVRRARVGTDETPHTFQPSVYLLHHQAIAPAETLAFTFVDVLANRADVVRGRGDLDDVERTVAYHPRPFREHAATREAFEHLCSTSVEREDVLGALGYEAYRDHFDRHELPDTTTKDGVDEGPFVDRLVERAIEVRGAPSTSESAVRGAMRQLVEMRKRALFREDLDALAEHVDTTLDDLATWLGTRFPVPETADMDAVRHRDLILRDLAAHRAGTPTRGSQEADRG